MCCLQTEKQQARYFGGAERHPKHMKRQLEKEIDRAAATIKVAQHLIHEKRPLVCSPSLTTV